MNALKSPVRPTYVEMFADIGSGARELAAAHADQLREEVSAEGHRAHNAVALIAAGSTAIGVAILFTFIAAAAALVEHLGWYMWTSLLMVAAVGVLVGVPLWLSGRRLLGQVNVIPRETLQSIGESLSWIVNAKR